MFICKTGVVATAVKPQKDENVFRNLARTTTNAKLITEVCKLQ
jgi:hypothetical protein